MEFIRKILDSFAIKPKGYEELEESNKDFLHSESESEPDFQFINIETDEKPKQDEIFIDSVPEIETDFEFINIETEIKPNEILPHPAENIDIEKQIENKQKEEHIINIDTSIQSENIAYTDNYFDPQIEPDIPYKSSRLIISGLHLFFIDIAREIVEQQSISIVPLLREYHLTESELKEIIHEIQDANIIDAEQNVIMNVDEFEKFIDIYEPSLFDCTHTVFDKDIFLCIGEIIFDKGVDDTYNSMPADEVVDYLNIMENLKIILYNSIENKYEILVDKEEFYKICECIPDNFSNSDYKKEESDCKNIDFDSLSGIEFERYCAYIISSNGYENIKITPPSGDHGIDILAEKDGISYAIQCKCYSDNIGNAAIQQAHTGKSLYHKDIAVVMTNRYFTAQAKEEAKALGVKLWDRDKLNEMIGKQD